MEIARPVPCGSLEMTSDKMVAGMFNPYDPDKEMTSLNGIVSIPKQVALACNQLAVMVQPFFHEPSQPPFSNDTTLIIQGSCAHVSKAALVFLGMLM